MAISPLSGSNIPAAQLEGIQADARDGDIRDGDLNVRYLMVKAALAIDEAKTGQIRMKMGELRELRNDLETMGQVIDHLSSQLSNKSAQDIMLQEQHSLIENLRRLSNHKLFAKTQWSREEAQTIISILTRKSERLQNESHEFSVRINRLVEDWHELFPLWKELMKALDDLINRINNRRA